MFLLKTLTKFKVQNSPTSHCNHGGKLLIPIRNKCQSSSSSSSSSHSSSSSSSSSPVLDKLRSKDLTPNETLLFKSNKINKGITSSPSNALRSAKQIDDVDSSISSKSNSDTDSDDDKEALKSTIRPLVTKEIVKVSNTTPAMRTGMKGSGGISQADKRVPSKASVQSSPSNALRSAKQIDDVDSSISSKSNYDTDSDDDMEALKSTIRPLVTKGIVKVSSATPAMSTGMKGSKASETRAPVLDKTAQLSIKRSDIKPVKAQVSKAPMKRSN